MKHFGKITVILMYLAIFALPFVCFCLNQFPPDAFTYCWFGFWTIEGIITAILSNIKLSHEQFKTVIGEVSPYINVDNAESVLERFSGIDFVKKLPKKKEESVG